MLLADKHDLQEKLKLSLILIEEKELNFYTQNCYTVGTQAALLSGFAFSAIVSGSDDAAVELQTLWGCFTTMAMLFEILAVVKSMQLSIMGPGLALRGPEGSMTRAVLVMRSEYKNIHMLFYTGLFFFHLSACLFLWSTYDTIVAAINSVLIALALIWLYFDFGALEKRLRLPGRHVSYDAATMHVLRPSAVDNQMGLQHSIGAKLSNGRDRATGVWSKNVTSRTSAFAAIGASKIGAIPRPRNPFTTGSVRRRKAISRAASAPRAAPKPNSKPNSTSSTPTKKRLRAMNACSFNYHKGSLSRSVPPQRSNSVPLGEGVYQHAAQEDESVYIDNSPPGTPTAERQGWFKDRANSSPEMVRCGWRPAPLLINGNLNAGAGHSARTDGANASFRRGQPMTVDGAVSNESSARAAAAAPGADGGAGTGAYAGENPGRGGAAAAPPPAKKGGLFGFFNFPAWGEGKEEESVGGASVVSRATESGMIDVCLHVVIDGEEQRHDVSLEPEATLRDARDAAGRALSLDPTMLALYMEMEKGKAEPVGTTDATLGVPLHALCTEMGIVEGSGQQLHLWVIQI
uniref:Uncharacterized protein n=1 Tax=Chrysotila carterae TaxID=13221 RepID=A0A7S4F8I0_CHRCT|mmetsp:Transcript_20719/g.45040  ORF Transcript_20719/g.45040 Transcript_20719/m.45040 type:complete len:574 (+) Transcript_20719:195-1916(+)